MTINWVTARFPLLISCRWKGKRARAPPRVSHCADRGSTSAIVIIYMHLVRCVVVWRLEAVATSRRGVDIDDFFCLPPLPPPPLLALLLLCVCRPLWSSVGGQLVAGGERQGGRGILGLALGVAQPSWQLSLPLLLLLIGIWYYKSIVIIQIIFSIFPWACRTCLYVCVCASPPSPCCLNTYQSFSIFGLSFCLLCF